MVAWASDLIYKNSSDELRIIQSINTSYSVPKQPWPYDPNYWAVTCIEPE